MGQLIDVPGHGPVEFPDDMSDADIAKAIKKNSMVASPSREEQKQAAINDMYKRPFGSGIPVVANKAGEAVTDFMSKYFPPAVAAGAGTLANVGIQASPSMLTSVRGIPALTDTELSRNALAAQRTEVLNKGRDIGLKVPPSQVNPSATNRVIESVGGKAATAQEAAATNENAVYAVAQREAGLNPSESINNETLAAARDRLAQPYRDIESLQTNSPLSKPPFKSPAQTLEQLRDTRSEAKKLWDYYERSKIPDVQRQAQNASARADQLEQTLEAHASNAGKPELVDALRQARVALAKNYTVQRAMRGSSFDPAALSRLESRAGTPLTGDLDTVMQMYRDFPRAMSAPQVGGSVGVSQLMPWLGGSAGGTIGALMGGAHGAGIGAPAGVILGQTIPPLARSLVLSGPYQSLMANAPVASGMSPALGALLGNPALIPDPMSGALYRR